MPHAKQPESTDKRKRLYHQSPIDANSPIKHRQNVTENPFLSLCPVISSCATYLRRSRYYTTITTTASTLPRPDSIPCRDPDPSHRREGGEGPFDHQSVTCTSARRSRPAADHKIDRDIGLVPYHPGMLVVRLACGLELFFVLVCASLIKRNEWTERSKRVRETRWDAATVKESRAGPTAR